MRCLITGISGFTGQHLARFLSLKAEADVWGLASPRATGAILDVPNRKLLHRDLNDKQTVCEFVHDVRPEVIFHLVGKTRGHDLAALRASNLSPTRVILELAGELDCRVFVSGSAAEYGVPQQLPIPEDHPVQPVTPYGESKAEQTALALAYAGRGVRVHVARTFNLIGPGLPQTFLWGNLVAQIAHESAQQELVLPVPELYRDLLDVRDAVEAYWQIVLRGQPGAVYNVCSGTAYSLTQVARELLRLANRTQTFQVEPGTSSAPSVVIGSNRKLYSILGWSPRIPLIDSLAAMLAYEKSRTPTLLQQPH